MGKEDNRLTTAKNHKKSRCKACKNIKENCNLVHKIILSDKEGIFIFKCADHRGRDADTNNAP